MDLTLNYYRSFLISTDLITLQGYQDQVQLGGGLGVDRSEESSAGLEKCHVDEYFVT